MYTLLCVCKEGRLKRCASYLQWKAVRFVMVLISWGNLFHILRAAPKKVWSPTQMGFIFVVESSIVPERQSSQSRSPSWSLGDLFASLGPVH